VLHADELSRRLQGTGVTAVSVHPGVVHTELWRQIPLAEALTSTVLAPLAYTFVKTPWEGAQTTLHTLLADDVPAHAGAYYADCRPLAVTNSHFTRANAAKLWEISERLVASISQ